MRTIFLWNQASYQYFFHLASHFSGSCIYIFMCWASVPLLNPSNIHLSICWTVNKSKMYAINQSEKLCMCVSIFLLLYVCVYVGACISTFAYSVCMFVHVWMCMHLFCVPAVVCMHICVQSVYFGIMLCYLMCVCFFQLWYEYIWVLCVYTSACVYICLPSLVCK